MITGNDDDMVMMEEIICRVLSLHCLSGYGDDDNDKGEDGRRGEEDVNLQDALLPVLQ